MCECSANMLTAVELAPRNGEFREWNEKQRNELVEWLLAVLTWQRLHDVAELPPECCQTSLGGDLRPVRPDKVAALLQPRKKADVLRAIQAIRSVLEGAMLFASDRK
ncbi:hypothetical protein KFL_002470035 [Klebsormidium nitens]|uniref:Uncharacterized protein n=1 Tax=Klebsormidium nitens TaxID=105231 RepID=A0A1Y1IAC5_KLENI|nr:hypothetical protein KFL_002470035 [Klebsormidium nitens]|eukprot:GAQ85646.1 hypothetical protein KFL_002470035 [Klebsormidium nitens]